MEHALIETYGCTLNQADSDMIEGILRQGGVHTERGTYSEVMNADYVIINTCTVKKPTEQKILDRIQKMNGKGARLIVTGCMASANPDRIRKAAPKARIISINNMPEMLPKMLNGNNGTSMLAYKRIDRSQFIYNPTGVIARIAGRRCLQGRSSRVQGRNHDKDSRASISLSPSISNSLATKRLSSSCSFIPECFLALSKSVPPLLSDFAATIFSICSLFFSTIFAVSLPVS